MALMLAGRWLHSAGCLGVNSSTQSGERSGFWMQVQWKLPSVGGRPRRRLVLGRPQSPAGVPEEGLDRRAVLHVGLPMEAVADGVLAERGGERLAAGGRHLHRRTPPADLLGRVVPGEGGRLLGAGRQSHLEDARAAPPLAAEEQLPVAVDQRPRDAELAVDRASRSPGRGRPTSGTADGARLCSIVTPAGRGRRISSGGTSGAAPPLAAAGWCAAARPHR